MSFEVISKEENTDEGYGRNYNSSRTINTTYKHPKGLVFKHVHTDGKDYEDIYRYELVTIGDISIFYSYDWGNYFITEYVKISQESVEGNKELSFAQQEYGAVDPLKTTSREKGNGKQILEKLGADFELSIEDFIKQLSKTFNVKLECILNPEVFTKRRQQHNDVYSRSTKHEYAHLLNKTRKFIQHDVKAAQTLDMSFEVITREEHTDEGYGRQYSAKRTITTSYKHPKCLVFKHVHQDGKDYEDRYCYETITIGDIKIRYSYDWGNYFTWEYVKISQNGDDDKELSYAEQKFGSVDPLKTNVRQKENGKAILEKVGAEFGLSVEDFVKQLSKTFNVKWDVLKLFIDKNS